MPQKLNLKKILDIVQIPLPDQANILCDLNEALGYGLYLRFHDKFEKKDKDDLKNLMQENKPDELIKLILKRTNKSEFQRIVYGESEKIIKEFLQGFITTINPKQKQEILKRLESYLPLE